MKFITKSILVVAIIGLVSCKGNNQPKEDYSKPKTETSKPIDEIDPMSSNGIGPVKELKLPDTIDKGLVAKGEENFKMYCTACHRVGKKFIGPDPTGVVERRTPAWIMNMILNPEEMTQKDPIAKKLLMENNGSPMANQHLTEEQARAILEYFRTL